MQLSFGTDEFGRLTCALADGEDQATVTAANLAGAAGDLAAALRDTAADGCSECYWMEGGGEYRWVFRREGDKVRVVVLWSAGTLTGWVHIFSSECELDALTSQVQDGLDRLPTPAA